jgi:hypothetical protein
LSFLKKRVFTGSLLILGHYNLLNAPLNACGQKQGILSPVDQLFGGWEIF